MSISVNVSGTWRDVAAPYINISGTWKEAQVYVNVSGTWKLVSISKLAAPTIYRSAYEYGGEQFRLTNIVTGATPKMQVRMTVSTNYVYVTRVSTSAGQVTLSGSTAWFNWSYPTEDSIFFVEGPSTNTAVQAWVEKAGYINSDVVLVTGIAGYNGCCACG